MFPDKLPNHKRFRFTHAQKFARGYQLSRVYYMKNYSVGMHIHDYYEVSIVEKGCGMHYIYGERIPVKEGDVFIIFPGTAHGYSGGEGFCAYNIIISDYFREKYLPEFQHIPPFYTIFASDSPLQDKYNFLLHLKLSAKQQKQILPLLKEAAHYSRLNTPYEALMSDGLTISILSALCKIYDENTKIDDTRVWHDIDFLKAVSEIHKHHNEKLSIDELAKIARLSRSAFIKKFKSICKMPPLEYITKTRFEAAQDLLINTNLPLSEIALRTGFYDAPHFSKVFAAKTGISPGQFRKEHNK